MAKLGKGLRFTGRIGDLTAYTMRGSDEIIVRTRSGPSKEKIKTHWSFVNTRRVNAEFGGRSVACKWINELLSHHRELADYNYIGHLNALIKPIQMMDKVSPWGERNILFSRDAQLLEGFSLNRGQLFESMVRQPVRFSINKESLRATIDIPELIPGINFVVQQRFPMYSFVATLGILPDICWKEGRYLAKAPQVSTAPISTVYTEWRPSNLRSAAETLELTILPPAPGMSFSLVVIIGITFGTMAGNGGVNQIKHAGAARIAGVS